jgi:hypothetical protein
MMRVKLIIKIYTFLVVFIFTPACTNSTFSGLKEDSSTKNYTPRTGQKIVENNGQIINDTGWQIPQIKNTTAGEPKIEEMLSVDGRRFNVRKTFFTPNETISYTEDGFSENVTRLHGKLKLVRFQEFKLKEKVFLYSILAREFDENKQANNNHMHKEMFIYQILDSDGDGKFETLIDNDSDVLIPKWATE